MRFLEAAEPEAHGIREVSVWSGSATLRRLPRRPWLRAAGHALLDGPLPARVAWQRTVLEREAAAHCDLLFVPGGTYTGGFRPFVTMSQNLLPFDPVAAATYGWSATRARLALLRSALATTFRRADGVIFLTRAARDQVLRRTGELPGRTTVIPHGTSPGFARETGLPCELADCSTERPFRWLYTSVVSPYKHQAQVARAVARLRRQGVPVSLDLIGPLDGRRAIRELRQVVAEEDPSGSFLRFHGPLPPEELPRWYHAADGFVFASSCETFGIVLLDAMAASLPTAAASHAVAEDVLGDAGAYFDPRDVGGIAAVLRGLMEDRDRRAELAARAHRRSAAYTWESTAERTLAFLASTAGTARAVPERAVRT